MKDINRIARLIVMLMATHSLVHAAPRGTYRRGYSQVSGRRSLQGGMDDKGMMTPQPTASPTISAQPSVSPAPSFRPTASAQPSSAPSSAPSPFPTAAPSPSPTEVPSAAPSASPTISKAPTISPAPTTAGFTIELDESQSTISAVCSTTFAASSSTALVQQIFDFQYYMYTNASKTRKVAEMDQRYIQPLAADVLDCSSSKGDYNFNVSGIVATVHADGSDATSCPNNENGTKCILAVGSFKALLRVADDGSSRRRRRRRQLIDQDLSDPDLIIAFGGILATLFDGTQLLDDEIQSMAFDGFINGFDPGNNDDDQDPTDDSSESATDPKSNLAVPIAASVVALVVAMALLFVVVQRRKRRTSNAEGFHDLDSGSWALDDDPSKHNRAMSIQEQSVDTSFDIRKLEASMRPEFDFEVNTVNHLLGPAREDDVPSDEEKETDPPLAYPSYLHSQRRISPPLYDTMDGYSTRSDLTPNTVDL